MRCEAKIETCFQSLRENLTIMLFIGKTLFRTLGVWNRPQPRVVLTMVVDRNHNGLHHFSLALCHGIEKKTLAETSLV